jgi:hypothetical protein
MVVCVVVVVVVVVLGMKKSPSFGMFGKLKTSFFSRANE